MYKLPLTSCIAGAPIIPCSGHFLPHIRNCHKLPTTAPKTTATTLACSLTSQLPTASTHAASITASHALDRQLSKLSSTPTVDFVDTIEFLDAASFTSAAEFPTVPLCHPSIVSSSLGQSSPKPQLSSAYCCVSCCVLPRTQSTDFCYCHTSCHLVATIQLCFSSAYTLMDFNPVTNLPHQKEVDVLVKPSLKHLYPKSAPLFIVQDCPNTTFRPCSYFHPECRPLILQCQANIFFVSSCPKPKP